MYDKASLIALFHQKALKFGQFTLASGRQASYYLDGKQVTLDAHGARLVAEGLLDLLAAAGPLPAAVGGMSIGADPITAAAVPLPGRRGLAAPCDRIGPLFVPHRLAGLTTRAIAFRALHTTSWTASALASGLRC